MIYPKFPRRTLALVLLCLVITLGAMGIFFLVYLFNENSDLFVDSSLKTGNVDQRKSQMFKTNVIGERSYQREAKDIYVKDLKENLDQMNIDGNRSFVLSSNEDLPMLSPSSQEILNNNERQASLYEKNTKSMGAKDPNLDTIYIDDFERPTFKSKDKSEMGIDYFDTILEDDKNNEKPRKASSVRLQLGDTSMHSIINQNNLISKSSNIFLKNVYENESKIKINNNHRENESQWNKIKIFNKSITPRNRDEENVYDLEINSVASGSGDFLDDTEMNEIFSRQINKKIHKLEGSPKKSRKNNNIRNSRYKKKTGNSILKYGNKMISSPVFLTTVFPVLAKKNKKLYAIVPQSKDTIQETSHSIFDLKSKKFDQLRATSHQKSTSSLSSESYNPSSSTSLYNDNYQTHLDLEEIDTTSSARADNVVTNLRDIGFGVGENNEAWIETRTRRIMGNVKKSEERSRQLLLCEEAGGGELCRMLFKGHINE